MLRTEINISASLAFIKYNSVNRIQKILIFKISLNLLGFLLSEPRVNKKHYNLIKPFQLIHQMYKPLFLIAFLSSISFLASSQSIPNNGFETCAITPPAPFESAEGWAGGPSISKSTNAHSGSFALQLETAVFTNPNNGETDTISGNAFTGTPGMGPGMPGTPGFAFTGRPDSLTGWYTYSTVGNDANEVRVILSRWDTLTLQREEIASTVFSCNPSELYSRYSFPIQYNNSNIPDTASIEIRSSNSPWKPQFSDLFCLLMI